LTVWGGQPQKHPAQPALDTAEELAKVKEQAANLGREVRATKG